MHVCEERTIVRTFLIRDQWNEVEKVMQISVGFEHGDEFDQQIRVESEDGREMHSVLDLNVDGRCFIVRLSIAFEDLNGIVGCLAPQEIDDFQTVVEWIIEQEDFTHLLESMRTTSERQTVKREVNLLIP